MSVSNTASAAMASLVSRMAALENELETVDKEMADNIDLDDYMESNSQKEKMHLDEHLDYYSDLSSPLNGSLDNFSSTTSISRHSDLTKSDQQPSIINGHLSNSISSNYTSRSPSFDISQSKHSTILDEALKIQLEKKHSEELEKIRQELEDTKNKHWSELQKSKNDLAEQYKENDRIRQELSLKHENEKDLLKKSLEVEKEKIIAEKDLLKKSHDIEKEKIIAEISTLSQQKKQIENNLNTMKESFENEKRLILQQHEKEKESLMSEHSVKFNNLSKSREDTESKINQLKNQYEAEKKDLENKLLLLHQSEKDKLLAEIKKNEETQSKLNNLQIVHDRALKELNELTINKETTKKTISDLERQLNDKSKLEVTSQELRQQLDKSNNELSNINLKLSNQLNEKKNLESELENLRSQLNDSNNKIKKLELQLELVTKEKEENNSKYSNELKSLRIEFENSLKNETERRQINHNEAITELRNNLESTHKTALESLQKQMAIQREEQIAAIQIEHNQKLESLKKVHEEKITKLINKNESLASENLLCIKAIEDATRRYDELNNKHIQFTEENLEMSTDLIDLRKKIEELEQKNLDLEKVKNTLSTEVSNISQEKEKIITELNIVKEEKQQLHEEGLTLKGELEEISCERDKYASVVNVVKVMKDEWEMQYQKLKLEKEQVESELDQLKKSLNEEKAMIKNRESEVQNELTRLKRETKEVSAKLKTIESEKSVLAKISEEKQDNLHQKNSELKDLRQKLEIFNQKLLELNKEKALTDNKVTILEDEKKRIEAELSKSKDENARLLDQLFNVGSSKGGDDEITKQKLQTRIESLEASTARLTARLQAANSDSAQIRKDFDNLARGLENRLTNSHLEIEELHTQITKLKEQLIEKTHPGGMHQQNINEEANQLAIAEQTIKSLKEQIEKYKSSQDDLEKKLFLVNKKLSEADDEQHANIRTFEQLIAQAEKTIMNLRSKMEKMQKEHAQDKDQLIRNHQNTIGMFNKQKEEEIAQITRTMQLRMEALEKRQRDMAATGSNDKDGFNSQKVIILEQEKDQLENSLRSLQAECARLNETLKQVQNGYLEAVNDKDQLITAKRETEKKIKAMEIKTESNRKEAQLQDVLAKNMELIVKMTSN
ncbi:42680_t:CDS:2 [Gigaspora margarita]|uniref:42680_t:CDS:1 n=1 Tax=Gigaspora margarita TaxID=4874 RepID=A0ABM8VXU1_GIGMA|nr:42680_t:CDS:2 [Gigaspora margarita]